MGRKRRRRRSKSEDSPPPMRVRLALLRGRVAGSRIPLIENTAGAAPKTKKDEKMEEEDGGKRSGRCGISFSLKVSFFSKKKYVSHALCFH